MFKTLRALKHRQREAEWMDDPNADPELIRKSLSYIRRINFLLRYTRATLGHFERLSRVWPRDKPIRVLDVATGSADIPLALQAWAAPRGFDIRITGVDLHPSTIQSAREAATGKISVAAADAMQLPFAHSAFDYAMTNMFLHHLDEDDVVRVLEEMNRVSSRGIIVADLKRSRFAYAGIVALTLASNPMVKHDARVSVRQAFTRDEIIALRDRAGIGFACYYSHVGSRFVLAGEKPST